jgi:hypothetical protein
LYEALPFASIKRKETKERVTPKKKDSRPLMYYMPSIRYRGFVWSLLHPLRGAPFMTIRLYNDTNRFELCVFRQITGVKPILPGILSADLGLRPL